MNTKPNGNDEFQDLLLKFQAFKLYADGGDHHTEIKKAFLNCATSRVMNDKDPEAAYWLSLEYLLTSDFKTLSVTAIQSLLEDNARKLHTASMHLLGKLYMSFIPAIPFGMQDKVRGRRLIGEALKLGFAPAFTTMVQIQDQQINRWLYPLNMKRLSKKFAGLNYAGAYLYMAEQILKKQNPTAQEKIDIRTLLEKAYAGRDAIHPVEQTISDTITFRLGVCYYDGLGGISKKEEGLEMIRSVEKEGSEALFWLDEKGLTKKTEEDQTSEKKEDVKKDQEEEKKPESNKRKNDDVKIPVDDTKGKFLFPQETWDQIKKNSNLESTPGKTEKIAKVKTKTREKSPLDLSPEHIQKLLAPLDKLTGLQSVKDEIHQLINLVRIREQRRAAGLKTDTINLHMVFAGNPGTGKTTVARLLGDIFKGLGLLSKGHVVEVSREDLVGEYIGHTEVRTQKVLEKAQGGVLFIDEAYTLTDQGFGWDYGMIALDTIAKVMEDKRDDFIVIAAGYKDEMKAFLRATPGITSRFSSQINFPDYTPEDMAVIFENLCLERDYTLDPLAKNVLVNGLKKEKANTDKKFGNARFVRQFFERTMLRQSARLSKMSEPSKEDLMRIDIRDLGFSGTVKSGNVVYLEPLK